MKKLIIAHRGASNLAPENTLEAFQKAIDLGADMIELDVRKTKDDVLVVVHDPDFQGKPVAGLSYRELSELSKNLIPRLEQVLQMCRGKIKLDVELKEAGYESLVGTVLLKNFNLADLMVTSFLPKTVLALHKQYPDIKIGLIVGGNINECRYVFRLIFSRSFREKFDVLCLDYRYILYGVYKFFLKNKILLVWTADDIGIMNKLLKIPEVSGVITNKPQLALRLREETNA